MKNSFGEHESSVKLKELFSIKSFQMQEPEKARIIFLGRDANFDIDIEKKDKLFFNEIVDYLENGIDYWKKHGFHTPMLKPCYNKKNGQRYHQKFRKLGFTSDDADDICFLELLSCCTYGNSSKNKSKFMKMVKDVKNKKHLERIVNLSKKENIRICIPYGVKTIIKEIDDLKSFDTNGKNIITHTHFSGSISNKDLEELKEKLHKFLKSK
jgi:hypothetical protein